MECVTFENQIHTTFSSVRDFSFEQKKSFLNEEKINKLLDAILDIKNFCKTKTEKLNSINEQIEKLTWFDNVSDEILLQLNDLISVMKDAYSTLIKQYISLNPIRLKGIAKEEIHNFKSAIDDLKESYQDLESVFFFLPEFSEFKETTKLLSLI